MCTTNKNATAPHSVFTAAQLLKKRKALNKKALEISKGKKK